MHETRGSQCFTKEACCQRVREIQNEFMDKRDFNDIPYNFLVGGDGRVYEGTGWHRQGGHTLDWNHRSVGIAAIGTFGEVAPKEETLEAIERLVNLGISNDNQYLTDTYTVLAHTQLVGEDYEVPCPGDAFFEEVKDMPHWCMADYETSEDSDLVDSEAEDNTSSDDLEEANWPKGYDEDYFGPWDGAIAD